ncbi:hypothetical protein [Phenylobacterium sp.]|uniref:hypothetical protein n=1 Tax=Phenylobacterium sp. TaxID=1871053 RepID=UPI0025FA3381|nr:hypothetical protein [Phenylobacterium sp.]
MRQLAKFSLEIRETDFVMRLTDETGEVAEFASSPEQLDLVIDVFNDVLSEEGQSEG